MGAHHEQEVTMANLYKRGDKWWARLKVSGKEYRRSLHTTSKTEAERRLKAIRKEIEDEVLFGIGPPMSWQNAVIAWNEQATSDLAPSTVVRYLNSLAMCNPFLHGTDLRKVDVPKLRSIVRERRTHGATTATIRRDLTAISSVLDYAIGEGWIQENATLTVRHKRMRERRDPITLPTEAAIKAMIEASPDRFADAIEFARETGMRQDEIFGLTRRQVGAGEITIKGKGRKLRVIPLTPLAKRILDRQPQFLSSQFVFWHSDGQRWTSPSSRFGDIQRRVSRKAAQEKREYHSFRFHDLRHLYAVEYLRAERGSLYDLQKLLGHSSVKTTEIYLEFLTPEQVKSAQHGGGTVRGTAVTVSA